jgi:Leucine-rich repeat (LRR) protein
VTITAAAAVLLLVGGLLTWVLRKPAMGTLKLAVEPDDATILIDKQPAQMFRAAIREPVGMDVHLEVAPGDHDIQVSKPGFVTQTLPVSVNSGQTVAIQLHLAGIEPASPPGREEAPTAARRVAEWVLKLGGKVGIVPDNGEPFTVVGEIGDLPKQPFQLQSILLVDNTRVTDADLEQFHGLSQLQALNLNGSPITDAGLKQLQGLESLQRLYLANTGVTGTGLEYLQGLKRLQRLDLHGARIGDSGLEQLRKCAALRWINLDGTAVSDVALGHLESLTGLTSLSVENTGVTEGGIKRLRSALPRCRVFYMSRVPTSPTPTVPAGPDRVAAEWALKLGMQVDIVPAQGGAVMTVTRVAALPTSAFRVQTLLMGSNVRLTDASLEHLHGLTQLQVLHLGKTGITDAGLVHLQELKSLRNLGLRNLRITDAGLAHLQQLNELRFLHMDNTLVTGPGLKYLKGMTRLEVLGLAGTMVTDTGLDAMKDVKNLQRLFLGRTRITDAGISPITALKSLQILALDGTGITDAGLWQLRRLKNLTAVSLPNTRVTDAGVRRFKMALPSCNITR